MQHEAEAQLAAYALGALDHDERQRVAEHLHGCATCRENLAAYERVADGLLHAAPARSPARRTRSELLKRIRKPARGFSWGIRLKPARLGLAFGLFLLVAVNVAFLAQNQRLLDHNQSLLYQQQAGQAAVAISSYPSSQVAVIEQDGIRGTFVYDPELPVGVVYLWGLEPPPEDKAYQAWLVEPDGQRLDGGLLSFSDERAFGWLMIEAPVPLQGFQSLGFTLEPAEGSDAPTGPRVVGTDL